jgi:hypothetical protein
VKLHPDKSPEKSPEAEHKAAEKFKEIGAASMMKAAEREEAGRA